MIQQRHVQRIALLCATIAILAAFGLHTRPAYAAPPVLWLPTPLGESWKIIQGFYCGTHTGGLARALDLVNLEGPTYGAPVRAAADGTTFVWDPRSGTIILSHGNGYYTEYTHLIAPFTTRAGVPVKQGDVIGQVGDVATRGNPHLHFVFFTANGPYAANRSGLELNFADGYSFQDTSGCNQHYGQIVVARGSDTVPPQVHFTSEAEVDKWYCSAERIEFNVSDDRRVQGFSQAFNNDPGGETPAFQSDMGYVELDWAGDGMHTLNIRAWDIQGNQALGTFGPVGYDASPPTLTAPDPLPVVRHPARAPFKLSWQPADDGNGAGIRGYKLYFGPDPAGTSDWFNEKAEIGIGAMPPGRYVLRVQAQDAACSSSEWVTVQEVVLLNGTEVPATPTDTGINPRATPTPRPSATATAPPSPTAAAEETPVPATAMPSPTAAVEETPTTVPTPTAQRTATPSSVPSPTPTTRVEATPTAPPPTPTPAAEDTATPPPTPTSTNKPAASPTATRTPAPTATRTTVPTAQGTPLPPPKVR